MAAASPARTALVVFLHVPKTAGLTLRRDVLKRQFREDEVFSTGWRDRGRAAGSRSVGVFSDELGAYGLFEGVQYPSAVWYPDPVPVAAAAFLALPGPSRERVRLIYARHTEFGVHEHLPGPVDYVTMLREPVERVLSHYFYAREPRVVPEATSLAEHVRDLVEANLQTRLLAGTFDPRDRPPPGQLLERARRNLRACRVVGLSERFDESVLLMRRAFGWRVPLYVRRNVGRHRPPTSAIPREALARIEADNALDVALHAEAQAIFAEQVLAYGPRALARDLAAFRSLNALWQRAYACADAVGDALLSLDRRAVEPTLRALGRWGGPRRLLPARLAPRVESAVEGTTLYLELRMGRRIVGSYDARAGRWVVRRPYQAFVDEASLPGTTPGGRDA